MTSDETRPDRDPCPICNRKRLWNVGHICPTVQGAAKFAGNSPDREALREQLVAEAKADPRCPSPADIAAFTAGVDAVLAVVEPALEAARNDAAHLERVVDEARHNESKARAALAQRDAEIERLRSPDLRVVYGYDTGHRDAEREAAAEIERLRAEADQAWADRDEWADRCDDARRRLAATEALLSAVEEITCTLDDPDGWTLGWHEAVELDRAVRDFRAALASGDQP